MRSHGSLTWLNFFAESRLREAIVRFTSCPKISNPPLSLSSLYCLLISSLFLSATLPTTKSQSLSLSSDQTSSPQLKLGAMKGGKAEKAKKADAKLSVKKKQVVEKAKPVKKGKAAKDPNKPKRPPSAFFVFMEEFRKTFKEKNPNNRSVSVVGKAGGDKWKTLSEAEKAPYVAKANKLKSEYNTKMNTYNKKQSEPRKSAAEEEYDESDKSKSEVNDDEDDEEDEEEEEDDD